MRARRAAGPSAPQPSAAGATRPARAAATASPASAGEAKAAATASPTVYRLEDDAPVPLHGAPQEVVVPPHGVPVGPPPTLTLGDATDPVGSPHSVPR
jgi:hypothetical protein